MKYVANSCGIDPEKTVSETKHLYAVGSIITAGCQDCTVWGSGLLNTRILNRLNNRTLDFRAVRGPLTRIVLLDHGFEVPPVYGDPAILMPLLFNPIVEKKFAKSLITHMDECSEERYNGIHRINITTDDYETVIREIKESELIISSSLHGIILAESYGVKAVLLKPVTDLFKYFDYYYSTKRYEFPIADSVEEARKIQPVDLPDLDIMRQGLMDAFPVDLWA